MSLPSFPPKDSLLTRDEAIDSLLTSIAMEEVALSHVLNAEGEKIQAAVAYAMKNMNCCVAIHDLLELNKSVSGLVDQINDMQVILKGKLKLVTSLIPPPPPTPRTCPSHKQKCCQPSPKPKPCPPLPPVPPKPNPCLPPSGHCATAVFLAKNNYCWRNGCILPLSASQCKSPIKLIQTPLGKVICLPCGKKYKIEVCLSIHKAVCDDNISVEILLMRGHETIKRKTITPDNYHSDIFVSEELEVPVSGDEYKLFIKLTSDENVKVEHGKIIVDEIHDY